MSNGESKSHETRRRAEEKFAQAKQRDSDVMKSQRQIFEAETAKFFRLRALRLAKEAAEKKALARATAESSAAGAKKRTGPAKPSGRCKTSPAKSPPES